MGRRGGVGDSLGTIDEEGDGGGGSGGGGGGGGGRGSVASQRHRDRGGGSVGAAKRERGTARYTDDVRPPLGATLLFLHAVDVFVSDAACRLAVFEARTAAAAAAAAAAKATVVGTPPSSVVSESPGGAAHPSSQSQVVPESPQTVSGVWALSLLQNSLLYRFVNDHIPTDSERSSFFTELLDLCGAAAERAAASQPADSLTSKMDPPSPLAPGAEDTSPDEIASAAHRLLSRLADLLDAMEGAYVGGAGGAGIKKDRTLTNIRTQLDECIRGYYRHNTRLYQVEAKRSFLGAMAGTPTHKLRLVRLVLQSTIMARHSKNLMHAGLGERIDAIGAKDVFDYVSLDPKTAIKSQKDSDGSADFVESIGRLGLMVGAAAQAAAALAPPGTDEDGKVIAAPYVEALRVANEGFTSEAIDNGEVVPKVAAALDAALGSCGVGVAT